MNYKKIETDSYNIHLAKVDTFKRIQVVVKFRRPFDKSKTVYRNMLSLILFEANNTYKTRRLLDIEIENLYDAGIGSGSSVRGNYATLSFGVDYLDEKYTEKGMFNKTLDFFFDLLLNPYIENDMFNEELFNKCKNILKDNIICENDNPSRCASNELAKIIGKGKPFSYSQVGDLKDLEKLTPKALYAYYKDILLNDTIDIFVTGNIPDNMDKLIIDRFNITNKKNIIKDMTITLDNYKDKYEEKSKKKKVKQSIFLLAYTFKDLTPLERDYTMNIFNHILGGSPSSKLFTTVREKNSLCYTISASYSALNGFGSVYAGIDKSNYEKVKELTIKEIDNMKKGLFTDEEVDTAIKAYLSTIDASYDSIFSITSLYISKEFYNIALPEEAKKIYKKFTKKDIITLANKININTIFLLEGSGNND